MVYGISSTLERFQINISAFFPFSIDPILFSIINDFAACKNMGAWTSSYVNVRFCLLTKRMFENRSFIMRRSPGAKVASVAWARPSHIFLYTYIANPTSIDFSHFDTRTYRITLRLGWVPPKRFWISSLTERLRLQYSTVQCKKALIKKDPEIFKKAWFF